MGRLPSESTAGVFLTKRLVEAMGGRIRVEGEPGKGSIFHLSLPVA